MTTRAEIIKRIERRLLQRKREELTWNDITQTVGGLPQDWKDQLVEYAKLNNGRKFTNIIFQALQQRMQNQARAEAQAMMSDNTLTLEDLQRFL